MALRSRHAAWCACSATELAWGRRAFSSGAVGDGPPAPGGFSLLDVFSKARRRQRAAALSADMQRGYFDDIKGATEKHVAPLHLVPAAAAMPLPGVPMVDAAGAAARVGLPGLACVVFRAGAARSAATWAPALRELLHAHGQLQYTQVSVVDAWLYTLPGLRSLLLRSGKEAPLGGGLGAHAFVFGGQHSDLLRRQVGLSNRLLPHLLLLDAKGRVRWKAAGDAAPEEVGALPRLVADMLKDE